MPERPVILFPTPERAGRSQKTPVFKNYRRPSFDRQYNRLQPTFQSLRTAFEQKNIIVQQSPVGINPDFALVFEIVGSVDNFYIAVNHCQGLEWLFDKDSSSIEPDDDFYEVENGDRSENSLDGKLYCVMSNQQAMEQLLSLWQRHLNGEEAVFQRGFAGIRDVFTKIKAIRRWDAQDRISETQVVDYWREMLAIDGDSLVPFEIELFYRDDSQKRSIASQTVTHEIQSLGGRILQECTIGEISYHAMLAELPRNAIEELINNYTGISLVHVDDIMFFRPACQTAFLSSTDTEALSVPLREYPLPSGDPIGAVLDGMPIQNHELLRGRLIIDDPDNYASGYESKYRTHGTSMASLAIYSDLNRNDAPVSTPIYMRPILRPCDVGIGKTEERVPSDRLFVDDLHRAVKRMIEGENREDAVAPSVKVINLSIGDPMRQLATEMSPLARLVDYLAYKYKLLFIISAGNHAEIINKIPGTFADLK